MSVSYKINQTKELGWLSYLSNILFPPSGQKVGGQKFFFAWSLRSQNCPPPHFQNRGAALEHIGPTTNNDVSIIAMNWNCLHLFPLHTYSCYKTWRLWVKCGFSPASIIHPHSAHPLWFLLAARRHSIACVVMPKAPSVGWRHSHSNKRQRLSVFLSRVYHPYAGHRYERCVRPSVCNTLILSLS